MIRGKNLLLLMDSSLEGQYSIEDATELVELASKCLQYEARDRPDVKFLLSAVAQLQKQREVSFSSALELQCYALFRRWIGDSIVYYFLYIAQN